MLTLAFGLERSFWPDQADAALRDTSTTQFLRTAVLLGRLEQWQAMEGLLLQPCNDRECNSLRLELLCGLHIRRGRLDQAATLLQDCMEADAPSSQGWWLRRAQLLLLQGHSVQVLSTPLPRNPNPLLQFLQLQALLEQGAIEAAKRLAEELRPSQNIPEAQLILARLDLMLGKPEQALQRLEQLLGRCPGDANAWAMAVHLLEQQPEHRAVHLTRAISRFPASSGLLGRQAADDLQNRRSSRGRRLALRERLHLPAAYAADIARSDTNLLNAYEHTGRADLVLALNPSLKARQQSDRQGLANQALHQATLQHHSYPNTVATLASLLPQPERLPTAPPHQKRLLRLGLVSPDLYYHPVGRFLYMALKAGLHRGGELHLIQTSRHQDRLNRFYREFCQQHDIHLHTIEDLEEANQLAQLRELKLDLAIDLAGWSSENAGHLFAPRIAPQQINYLGYFASSGLPAMDYWLGDQHLFPEPMQEWHSEQILRLPRCFLAWQPVAELPEGQMEVPAPPHANTPLRFGSFNHARKLSLATLRLWGRILHAIPRSQLVLKSFTSDDPGVVQLLRRRMGHCGIEPERVQWLPTCPDAADHLRQYGLMDVALDPFPNGGCTTTCEALWMGVPVITLAGNHYVSRMATAVLQGAGLPQWIAHSEEHYLELALQAADQQAQLRQGREALRQQLQANPLGDAAGLNAALWACFQQLQPSP